VYARLLYGTRVSTVKSSDPFDPETVVSWEMLSMMRQRQNGVSMLACVEGLTCNKAVIVLKCEQFNRELNFD
jgi:hypothetical protein